MSIRTTIAAALATAMTLTGITTPAHADTNGIADAVADAAAGAVAAGVDAGADTHADDEVLLTDAALEAMATDIIADAFTTNTDTDADGDVDRGALSDRDGDGIPDAWETHGVTLADGTVLNLPAWGANPDEKDLFLQLNWMQSEFTTLGCHTRTPENTNACDNASTKSYRPTANTLEQLVDLFADHDIALHIDAGATYTTMDNYPTLHGGETLTHTAYAFNGQSPLAALTGYQNDLLGTRAAVFHLGVIGDQMAYRDYSTGQGMVHGNTFYVANHTRMHTQEELRNTILHELGHNLGLRHNGHNDYVQGLPNNRMHPDYHSVMNYTYQLNPAYFTYSTKAYTRTDNGHTREIPADWDVLTLATYTKGTARHTIGTDTADNETTRAAIDATNQAKTKAREAAARNNTATLTANTTDTAAVAPGDTVAIAYTLTNPGIDTTTYRIDTTYPGGTDTQHVTLDGALTGHNTTTITINVTAADIATMPIDITVTAAGQTVAHTTHTITTTHTTTHHGATNTKPNNAPANNTPANTQAETAKVETVKVDTPKTNASVNIAAIIAPIIIALIAAIGAGFAMMNM